MKWNEEEKRREKRTRTRTMDGDGMTRRVRWTDIGQYCIFNEFASRRYRYRRCFLHFFFIFSWRKGAPNTVFYIFIFDFVVCQPCPCPYWIPFEKWCVLILERCTSWRAQVRAHNVRRSSISFTHLILMNFSLTLKNVNAINERVNF